MSTVEERSDAANAALLKAEQDHAAAHDAVAEAIRVRNEAAQTIAALRAARDFAQREFVTDRIAQKLIALGKLRPVAKRKHAGLDENGKSVFETVFEPIELRDAVREWQLAQDDPQLAVEIAAIGYGIAGPRMLEMLGLQE